MLLEKCCCSCVELRAGCIVLSIWKLIGNGCLSFVETGELRHNSRYSVLIACNIFGMMACFCLLYGAIQYSRVALMICLIFEMGEILLVFVYCALVLGYLLKAETYDVGMIETDVLFFILAFGLIYFWMFVFMLYRKTKTNENVENGIAITLQF